jgi:hypothetical protein
MGTLSTSYIESTLRRLATGGDLDVIMLLVRGAATLVEDELLKKLATFPVGDPSDLSAFAYRQGWLRALRQMEALFDPERVRRDESARDDYARTTFDHERL